MSVLETISLPLAPSTPDEAECNHEEGAVGGKPEASAEPRHSGRAADPKRDEKDHGRRIRRANAISAYIGANGSGKSLAMIYDTLPTLDGIPWECENASHRHMAPDYVDPMTGEIGPATSGLRRVLSTVELLESTTGLPHPLFTLLCDANGGWMQVIHAEHCDLLFDEVTGIAGSREAMGMPVAVQNILQQLRRRDVLLRWTAPSWARADSIIRSCTQAVTVCRGYFPDHRMVRRSSTPPAWVPNRAFKLRTFSAFDFDEWTTAKGAADKKGSPSGTALRAKPVAWIWGPGCRAFASYSTTDAVSRIGEVLDGGRCAACGGRRAVPVCKC